MYLKKTAICEDEMIDRSTVSSLKSLFLDDIHLLLTHNHLIERGIEMQGRGRREGKGMRISPVSFVEVTALHP